MQIIYFKQNTLIEHTSTNWHFNRIILYAAWALPCIGMVYQTPCTASWLTLLFYQAYPSKMELTKFMQKMLVWM